MFFAIITTIITTINHPWHQPPVVGGIYVSQSGFSFGLQIPVSAVITSVAQKKVTSLTDFEQALAGVPNKAAAVKGKKNRGGGAGWGPQDS